MMPIVIFQPVQLNIFNEAWYWLPGVVGIIVPFPMDISLAVAISNPVLENFLDYHGIIFRHLSVGSVVVQHNFAAIHRWKIQLEAVGMNLQDRSTQCYFVAASQAHSLEYFSWS